MISSTGPIVPIEWAGSMQAGTRQALELLPARTGFDWFSAAAIAPPSGRSEYPDTALSTLVSLDRITLSQGRAANRSANVTPSRRLSVDLAHAAEPVPAVIALQALISEQASGYQSPDDYLVAVAS